MPLSFADVTKLFRIEVPRVSGGDVFSGLAIESPRVDVFG